MDEERFRFISVGNYFFPDRKRLLELIDGFSNMFAAENCELYVKTTVMDGPPRTEDIEKFCQKYDNVILDRRSLLTSELIDVYCTSHAALFPAYGEGFGMPHAELTLLGRPLVIANNTALTTMSNYMPDVYKVECRELVESNYSLQCISNAGHWFKCDMNEFLVQAKNVYERWLFNKEAFRDNIVKNHLENDMQEYISHHRIKELLRIAVLEQLEQCK
jgi:hypothetical protein